MSATALTIGTGAGGVGRSDTTLKVVGSFLSSNDVVDFILTNPNSPLYVEEKNLANGANTCTVPARAGGVVIVPPEQSSWSPTLKGVAGDTGIALAKVAPHLLCFGTTPPASFVLNWPGPSFNAEAVTVQNAADTITRAAHGLVAGDQVYFAATTMPSPLVAGTWYYVVNPAANTFQLALTAGGPVIDITSDGTAVTMFTARTFKLAWI